MKNKFNKFGIMLDCSRNAVRTPETVKNYISLLKKVGYNCVFLYIEDTYEVAKNPYFGYLRGRYTEEQLRDIVEFGDSIGVEIIPCMQTLAHLNATLRWDKIPIDCADIMLVDNERTYELIEDMFASLAKSFTTNKIHIGMDEAHMLGRGAHLDIHGYEEIAPIMKRHLTRVKEIANKYFDEVLIWSDMYIRAFNNGNYYFYKPVTVPKEIRDSLPEGIIPVYWDYYHDDVETYDINLDAHLQLSKSTWFAGGAWTWGGFLPHNTFSTPAMEAGIRSALKHKVKNVFMTMWGDDGAECSIYSILPSLFAIAEFAKGNFDTDKIKATFKKHIGIDYDDFMLLDAANYVDGELRSKSLLKPPNPAKYMLFSDPFNGFLDVTVLGGEGKKYSELAPKLSEVAKRSRKYGYIFKTASALCSVLEIKFELGVKTRALYKAGDKAGLLALANNEYTELEKRIKLFHKSFREQWFRENHPSGFDVQELRIGGLLLRLASCRDRLRDYAAGKTESIPELEAELIAYPFRGTDVADEPVYANQYQTIATPNVF